MHAHHSHPFAVQSAAFFIALIPVLLLFVMMTGAQYFDRLRRARKPAPVRPLPLAVVTRPRAFAPAD